MRIFMLPRYLTVLLSACLLPASSVALAKQKPVPPNILFIIMDDVGIDQLSAFGYGGTTPPAMPNVNTIANKSVRFRNNWSMPACSPSRAVFFEGRFPMRSNVLGALGPDDLANSMVSPFDITVPKLLKQRNYQSGLFGKFHLGLQGNNPYGLGMPHSLGWDYFWGWLDETGDPSSIDTTAGGVAAAGTYSCGFVPGSDHGGADQGACYKPDNSCSDVSAAAGAINPPGRACRDSGGIFDPGKSCQASRPAYIDFSQMSAHYVSPVVINHDDGRVESVPPQDIRARGYRGSAHIDAAIEWIQSRPQGTPWMASVSFATVHTPLQQPPVALLPSDALNTNGINCASTSPEDSFPLNNQMIEAMDSEIGRLLTSIGLARRNSDGSLSYDPKSTDTMVVLVDDNGSLGYTVKQPFDPSRSKGTPYQTGIWTPLLVAGPKVNKLNRDVKHMTNIADLYQLFGEIAGIDVHKSVPWQIDSKPMLPYLANPNQGGIRKFNYSQIDLNLQANGGLNGPCQFANSCSHIPVSKSVCEDNGGVWWGVGADAPGTAGTQGLAHCCDVQVYLTNNGRANEVVSIIPQGAIAVRNQHYKFVQNFTKNYDASSNACVDTQTEELYQVNEDKTLPKLDREGSDLLVNGVSALKPQAKRNYQALKDRLARLQQSDVDCPGDGNLDLRVDQKDIDEWNKFSRMNGGLSSWYDFNLDGLTDQADYQIILDNLGTQCKPTKTGSSQ
ncbi:sulfatase-like hydrolase/transferase [Methyloterricola oryzae]|uniref:sulfatase-like hydrolase/transferase n=1 Tax=Methyloterricola oryzae TaxID=1495050 RepID=UPI0005EBDA69|nr:sulfatase-like hydrolase/transferase [Methyloterricola oryzae]